MAQIMIFSKEDIDAVITGARRSPQEHWEYAKDGVHVPWWVSFRHKEDYCTYVVHRMKDSVTDNEESVKRDGYAIYQAVYGDTK